MPKKELQTSKTLPIHRAASIGAYALLWCVRRWGNNSIVPAITTDGDAMVSAIHLGTFTSGKISESTGTDTALDYMEKEEALLKRSQPDDVGDILDAPSPSDRAQSPDSEPKSTDLSGELKSPAEQMGGEDKSPDTNHAPKPRNRRKSSFSGAASPTRRRASSVGHESKPPAAKSSQVEAPDAAAAAADAAIQEERDG